MNKLHVSLLAILCAVSGLKAEGFSLHDKLQEVRSEIVANTKNSKRLLILGKDALVYNSAPDVVGKVTGAVNYITPEFIKNKVPALPAIIANRIPNAVNAENANRVLTEGLIQLLLSDNSVQVKRGNVYLGAKVPVSLNNIKNDGKVAVNSMIDAVVAITAVEALAIPANAAVNTFAGEHAETVFGYASYARTVTYAICKQLSAAYMPKLFA